MNNALATVQLTDWHTRWNAASHVTACTECEGAGWVHAHRRPTVNDPYPENPCECGLGEHLPECGVCGFTQPVAGYDCIVCDTVASLIDADLRRLDVDEFSAAMRVAVEKALAENAVAVRGIAA